jgi:hypothetical protein
VITLDDRRAQGAYLGARDAFDRSVTDFAERYAVPACCRAAC